MVKDTARIDISADNRKKAFTLAEVLITLGVIGIVAAMTLPSLIRDHKKKVLETSFKTSYSLIGQLLQLVKADTGLSSLYDYYVVYDPNNGGYYMQTEFKNEVEKHLKLLKIPADPGYLTYDGSKKYGADASTYVVGKFKYALANGAFINYGISGSLDGKKISFTVDTNGLKGPNRVGFDVFQFAVYDHSDQLKGSKMLKLYTEEEAEANLHKGLAGLPCSMKSKQTTNGIGCAWYALANQCPDDPKKGYWDCLPK